MKVQRSSTPRDVLGVPMLPPAPVSMAARSARSVLERLSGVLAPPPLVVRRERL